jgi:hypothetical protein
LRPNWLARIDAGRLAPMSDALGKEELHALPIALKGDKPMVHLDTIVFHVWILASGYGFKGEA